MCYIEADDYGAFESCIVYGTQPADGTPVVAWKNSVDEYTTEAMSYTFDPLLPAGSSIPVADFQDKTPGNYGEHIFKCLVVIII